MKKCLLLVILMIVLRTTPSLAQTTSYSNALSYRGLTLGSATEQEVLAVLGSPKERFVLVRGGKDLIFQSRDPQVKEIQARMILDAQAILRLDRLDLLMAQPPKIEEARQWFALTLPVDEGPVSFGDKNCLGEFYEQGFVGLISCDKGMSVSAIRYMAPRGFAEYLANIPFKESNPEGAEKKSRYLKLADRIFPLPRTLSLSDPIQYRALTFGVWDKQGTDFRFKSYYPGEPASWGLEDQVNVPPNPMIWKMITFTLASPDQGNMHLVRKDSYRHQSLHTSKTYEFKIPNYLQEGDYDATITAEYWQQGAHRPFFSKKNTKSLTIGPK